MHADRPAWEQMVDVESGHVRAVTVGDDGPRVVFIPPLGGSFELYEPLIQVLALSARVTVIEPKGGGGSVAPKGMPSTRTLALDVCDGMTALGLERAHLIGLSLGGMIAQWTASLTAPLSLTLASTVVRGLRGILSGDVRNAALARCLLAPDDVEATATIAEDLLEDRADAALLEHVEEAAEEHPIPKRSLLWLSVAAARHDGRDAMAAIDCPLRILSGALDSIFPPPKQAELMEGHPSAEQTIFADAGHDVALEVTEVMASTCMAFIESCSVSPRGRP